MQLIISGGGKRRATECDLITERPPGFPLFPPSHFPWLVLSLSFSLFDASLLARARSDRRDNDFHPGITRESHGSSKRCVQASLGPSSADEIVEAREIEEEGA